VIKSVSRESIKFVPAYSGNREDENPLYVMIHSLNRMEFDKYAKKTKYFQKPGGRGEWDSNAFEVQKKQFTENVSEVHNFIDSETGTEITSIEKFYEESPHALIDEILQAILDISQMRDFEIKN